MRLIDISWPITEHMTAYKDRSVLQLKEHKTFHADEVRETIITLGSHNGTHIDAPAHFLADGTSIDHIALNSCIGKAQVVDMMHVKDAIEPKHLQDLTVDAGAILLFKTINSDKAPTDSFDYDFVYVKASAAEQLAALPIKAVGIDYLGIERAQPGHETHKTFMKKNIPIIEGLRLAHVNPGAYTLWCLPLSLPGLDAAPARAVLVTQ